MNTLNVPGQFAEVFGLGVPTRVFMVRKSSRLGSLVAGIALLILAGAALIGGSWYTYAQVGRYGPAILWGTLSPFLVAGAIGAGLSIVFILTAYRNWKKSAVLYEKGIAFRDRKGVRWMRWDEIESMQSAVTKRYTNGIYTGTTHVYTILEKEGEKHVLTDTLAQVEELAECIRQNVFPLVYSRTSEAYNLGQRVSFGPISIARSEGIQVGKKTIPWNEISQVSVNNGFFRVGKKGGGMFSGATVAASKIPNMEVLISLVDQIVGVKLP